MRINLSWILRWFEAIFRIRINLEKRKKKKKLNLIRGVSNVEELVLE